MAWYRKEKGISHGDETCWSDRCTVAAHSLSASCSQHNVSGIKLFTLVPAKGPVCYEAGKVIMGFGKK